MMNDKKYIFSKSFLAMELLLGGTNPTQGELLFMGTEFGYNGFSFTLYDYHITFFQELNAFLEKNTSIDHLSKTRWITINKLIIFFLTQNPPTDKSDENFIKRESLNLASCVAFPVIEEMARRMSGYWDEEGIMLRNQPSEIELFTEKTNEEKEKRIYKKGKRIIDFSHKLELLEYSLSVDLKKTIKSLKCVMEKSPIKDDSTKMIALYDRLRFQRDNWLHGRKFDGLVAPFLSIYLSLIYFENN